MTLSIIIPAYNAERFLQPCIESILSQGYNDYEIICIDDGSTDSTPALLRDYEARHPNLRLLQQENSGMATARNRGLDAAQGEYILFVDSDDLLSDNALASLAPHLTGEDIVGFNAQQLDDTTGTVTYRPSVTVPERNAGWDHFCRHRLEATAIHFVCIWQRAYRRRFLVEKGLRFLDGLRRAEDDLFTTQAMLAAATLKTISDCLYTYRIHAHSITRTDDPALDADSLRVHRILEESILPLEGIDKEALCRVLASNYITRLSHTPSPELSPGEWRRFRQECVTPRHRRLYHLAHIHPALLRLYLSLAR